MSTSERYHCQPSNLDDSQADYRRSENQDSFMTVSSAGMGRGDDTHERNNDSEAQRYPSYHDHGEHYYYHYPGYWGNYVPDRMTGMYPMEQPSRERGSRYSPANDRDIQFYLFEFQLVLHLLSLNNMDEESSKKHVTLINSVPTGWNL